MMFPPTETQLFPHQQQWMARTWEALRKYDRVLVTGECGSGKRYCQVWNCEQAIRHGRRSLILADRQVLIDQLKNHCRQNGIEYGICMGSAPTNYSAPVQIATIQTLRSRHLRPLQAMGNINLVQIDEAHNNPAAYHWLMNALPNAKHLLYTASPLGPDCMPMTPGYAEVKVEGPANSWLIQNKYLLPTQLWAPSSPMEVPNAKGREFSEAEKVHMMSLLAEADIREWFEKFPDRKTICFVPGVKWAHGLAEQFCLWGYRAEAIDGRHTRKEKQAIIERYKHGDTQILCSVRVLREGFDATAASLLIDLQPNKSFPNWWQKVRRVARAHEGQTDAVVLDFSGNCHRFIHPDDDPFWDSWAGCKTIEDLYNEPERDPLEPFLDPEPKEPILCPKCNYLMKPAQAADGCPNCQAPAPARAMKYVRCMDGSLELVPTCKPRKPQQTQEQKDWTSMIFRGAYLGQTFKQLAAQWSRSHDGKPPWKFNVSPLPIGKREWAMTPRELYPWTRKNDKDSTEQGNVTAAASNPSGAH